MKYVKLFEEFKFRNPFRNQFKKLENKDVDSVLHIIEEFSKRNNLGKTIHFEDGSTKDILFFKSGIDIRFYTNNLESINLRISGYHSWPGNTPNDVANDLIKTLNILKSLKLKVRGIPKELPSRSFNITIKP